MDLKFDMTDPTTKATVQGWEDGTEYPIVMVDSKAGTATYEEPTETEEAPTETEGATPAPGPAAVSAAMGSAMGG